MLAKLLINVEQARNRNFDLRDLARVVVVVVEVAGEGEEPWLLLAE